MKTVVPDYFMQFQCIADRCRHTCCAGWEIDVDEASLEYYGKVPGALGEKLRENIVTDECPHFKLTPDERCPFLNEQNLCELILNLGEDSLCQICSDHPRFRSYFSDRTEIGLGLCCEAAASLILNRQEKTVLLVSDDGQEEYEDKFEQDILAVRERAFEIIQDRTFPMEQRTERLLKEFEVQLPKKSAAGWANFFGSLERLDSAWDEQLSLLRASRTDGAETAPVCLEIPLEQLLVYFLYRHMPDVQDETDVKPCLAFAVLGYRIIRKLCLLRGKSCSADDLAETARLYSSEIEYSEENTEALMQILWDENNQYDG